MASTYKFLCRRRGRNLGILQDQHLAIRRLHNSVVFSQQSRLTFRVHSAAAGGSEPQTLILNVTRTNISRCHPNKYSNKLFVTNMRKSASSTPRLPNPNCILSAQKGQKCKSGFPSEFRSICAHSMERGGGPQTDTHSQFSFQTVFPVIFSKNIKLALPGDGTSPCKCLAGGPC